MPLIVKLIKLLWIDLLDLIDTGAPEGLLAAMLCLLAPYIKVWMLWCRIFCQTASQTARHFTADERILSTRSMSPFTDDC